ncbi:DUF5694 domain-containing protein [Aquimarina megaterium]|uniref:DUF5694 domain-containing protein n=1 Tax=Aquimarina megaterium TaxID=1443666 RepID=UPI0004704206|nr:DUF5694 domain-containing protein [Aquimarina megaterium]
MKHLTILFLVISILSCSSENKTRIIKKASEYYPKEKAKVLMVGTFHFNYPGLDVVKVTPENQIDVLKEPKKSEVNELVNYIKKFKPNKIAIEATPKWNATRKLKKYKGGEYRDQRDERFQIGMRIANELKLDTLYAIDANSMSDDIEKLDSIYTKKLYKDFDFQNDDPYRKMTLNWYKGEDEIIPKTNLLDYFKHLNSRESHLYGYGAYLVGDFKLDNERGADILSFWWYNRNVRIFRKLQKITENNEDRILVLIGNGHAAVLRHLLESSPEYDFVEFDSL